MKPIEERINKIDWEAVGEELHQKGYAIISELLSRENCESMLALYDKPEGYRKKVVMARHRFGLGEYKYFDYPLPDLVHTIRTKVYQHLVPIANSWMQVLRVRKSFPSTLDDLRKLCLENHQDKPTPLILRYGKGGFNTLHQDLYGEVYFPMQLVLFLNEPGLDYEGGEFVLIQQTPRAQSKAIVLTPRKGDMLIFATNFRPVKGNNRYYRVIMKHGVSELHSGKRHTLGIIFHDAQS